MLYKTVAKLLYMLRCEDYFAQAKPHQSMHPAYSSLDLTSNPTKELPADSPLKSIQWKNQPSIQSNKFSITHTTNTSKKAMENPASTGEETHTEEGATPPGNEIHHNQVPHSHYQYSGMMVCYVEGPKMDWTVDDASTPDLYDGKLKVKTSLTVKLLSFKRVLNAKKSSNGQEMQDLICTFHGLFQQQKSHFYRPYGQSLKIYKI